MNEDHNNPYDFSLCETERLVLENRWDKGELDRREAELCEFLKHHIPELRLMFGPHAEDEKVLDSVRFLIIGKGTVDHSSEMMDQAKEISDHFWIEGEKGNHEQADLFFDWTLNYAPQWRRWRILEYLFVAEKYGVEIYRSLTS